MQNILFDLRYALRQLRKSPGFVIVSILTLALGIGANTAIFSVVNALMLRPLPYPEPARLGALITHWSSAAGMQDTDNTDGETYYAVRDQVSAVTAAAYSSGKGVNLEAGHSVRYVQNQRVSSRYFDVLGVPPLIGRSFTKEEMLPRGPNVAILSNRLWRNTFHTDPYIVGQSILLKGEAYTVVGVLPRAQSPQTADVWTPLKPTRTGEGAGTNYGVLLRLKPGSNWAQANAQLNSVRPTYFFQWLTAHSGSTVHLQAIPLQTMEAEPLRPAISGLMIAVGFILLIACANLAGLGLVRAHRRSGEMATRMALGANPFALIRQLWTENIVLALIGGAVGIGIAESSLFLLQHMIPEGLLPTTNFDLDGRVLFFTFVVSITASILFGMLPALELRRIDLRWALASSANRALSNVGHRKIRTLLIAGEIALTVVLVAASGLLVRSLIYLETLPPGFDASNVITGKVSLDNARYNNPAVFQHLLSMSLDAMQRTPGVENAAVGLTLPFERSLNNGVTIADGKNIGKQFITDEVYVTPDYFDVLRMHLIAGRKFADSDTAQSQPVAIVNAAFARKYLGQSNPVGRHLGSSMADKSDESIAIVGEVADVIQPPGFDSSAPLATEPALYIPASQIDRMFLLTVHVWFQPSWIVRTKGPTTGITENMQHALAEADPMLPFSGFYSMADLEQHALGMQRIEVALLGSLAGLALLLSAIGIYGLIANLVVQRTREIGIRMALGSSVQQAMLEIGRSGIIATVLGLGVGMATSLLALRALKSFIYGIGAYDSFTLTGTALVLGTIAIVAAFLPTRHIAHIDPAKTLREE